MNFLTNTKLAIQGIYGSVMLLRDPSKLDKVFTILDSLEGSDKAEEAAKEFVDNPAFDRVFNDKPGLTNIDLASLATMPEGTLGRIFADEFKARGLRAEDIQLRADDGTKQGYVFKHLRETHDVWHTVTGFDVDVPGELGLQAFYLAQFNSGLSMVILALGFLNTLFYAPADRIARVDAIARGWQMGRAAKPLFGVDWAARWNTPLESIREELGVVAVRAQQPMLMPVAA